jgi:Domain of unknown function (DUF4180)
MAEGCYELHGTRIYEFAADGGPLREAAEMLNVAFNHRARFIVIPAARLGEDFFRLKTRIAGEMLGKLTTYRVRVAIVGDISSYVAESESLRDFVYESNRGSQIWFVANSEELEKRLKES